ncbi:MAG: envelope biogenesis factor ElyC [Syntrophales bacterium LBB04]|nr:envelope biogenesis factor ElyC [Syntrophales bacterium LBB04]
MFLFKKIVSPLFSPMTLILVLFLIGLVLLLFTRRQKTGKAVMTFGVIMLALLGYGSFSDLLLIPLERQYPPLMMESATGGLSSSDSIHSAKWIVLLGGGHTANPGIPVTSQISNESLTRLVECVRIHRLIAGSKIILSGGAVYDSSSEARTFAKVAAILNVNARDIVLDDVSRDTEEQAQNIRSIVGQDRIILVTSAYHMPRSMAIFNKAGLKPIPAPTNHLVKDRQMNAPEDFYPSPMGLLKAEHAMHEYLGLLWFNMRYSL